MKTKIFFAALVSITITATAQTTNFDYLDINNIKAGVHDQGSLFWDFANAKFEVPKGSNHHTIFANELWVGGIDASATLKVAGGTYRQTGNDYWPGPLNSAGTTNASTIAAYDRVWKLNQCDIDAYVNWFNGGTIGVNPVDSVAMNTIMNWPAVSSFGDPLAPFADVNTNGIYEPLAGDYPLIKGDQAIFFVYNDKGGPHTETGGTPIGLEFQCMVYGYSCPDDSALYNTIFTNYKIINKSSFRIDSTFIGNWTDFDIGSASDDFVGCDVARSAYYGYNGDATDDFPPAGQLPYGANPPAQAVVFLAGPYSDPNGIDDPAASVPNGLNYGDAIVDNERLGMSHFLYYNNDFSVTGNPSTATDYYNYLTGVWQDATPWTYGGSGHVTGVPCDYLYPGPSDPSGFGTNGVPQPAWDETTAANVPGDRRGVGSYGPFTMQPGATQEIDFAYVFGRATSGGNLASVVVMQERIDSVRQKFKNGIVGCGCNSVMGINEQNSDELFFIYPNPASDYVTIQIPSGKENFSVRIIDLAGRVVKELNNLGSGNKKIDVSDLAEGVYVINLQSVKTNSTQRFIKQ